MEETQKTPPPFIIGIICNGNNELDLEYYRAEFRLINKLYKEKVRLLFIGYNPEESTVLDGLDYEFTKPVSINHFFRHVHALKLDMLFIPQEQNVFNSTSENYNKLTEVSLFGIPVITCQQYPYGRILKDKHSGFLYPDKQSFIAYLKALLIGELPTVKITGANAYEFCFQNLQYSQENRALLNAALD